MRNRLFHFGKPPQKGKEARPESRRSQVSPAVRGLTDESVWFLLKVVYLEDLEHLGDLRVSGNNTQGLCSFHSPVLIHPPVAVMQGDGTWWTTGHHLRSLMGPVDDSVSCNLGGSWGLDIIPM